MHPPVMDGKTRKGVHNSIQPIKSMQSSSGVIVDRVEGVYIYGPNNEKWLDFASSTNNLVLGHNPPELTNALISHLQQQRPIHSSSRYHVTTLDRYLHTLQKFLPAELSRVNYKLTNGSDAVEDAIKAAISFHQKQMSDQVAVIVFSKAHHGETIGTIAASPKHHNSGNKWHNLLDPIFIEVPNFAQLETLDHIVRASCVKAILLEPVMVNAGVLVPPHNYLNELRHMCNENGLTLIFDEVQTGAGWLGTYTASEYFGVVPDIASYAKGLGNGLSIALTAMKPEYDVLGYEDTAFTTGGTPLAMAGAIAVIDALSDYMDQVEEKGAYLRNMINRAVMDKEVVEEIRSVAMMVGVNFNDSQIASHVYNSCIKNGLILRKSGDGYTLIWKPPIITSYAQLDEAVTIFEKVLDDC